MSVSDDGSLLKLQGLEAGYGDLRVLHDVSLEVPAGSVVAVLGPNGAGKSTLMHTLAGVHPASVGSIELDGERVTDASSSQRCERGIALVPEGRSGLFRTLTVAENLQLAVRSTDRSEPSDRQDPFRVARQLFPRLVERRDQQAGLLSGGEQQMLAMCAVLLRRPRLLLLDEPSLGLAPVIVDELYRVLHTLRDGGMTVVLVEEKADRALALADYAYVILGGRVVFAGTPEALRGEGGLGRIIFGRRLPDDEHY